MFRFASVGTLAGGATVLGLVWASRVIRSRVQNAKAPSRGFTEETATGELDRGWEADALDDVERSEAKREARVSPPGDIDFDLYDEPDGIDALDLAATYELERVDVADEPYDALDAEDVGTEWLLRATQTSAPERTDPSELYRIDAVETSVPGEEGPNSAAFGSDQQGEPLAEYAGTHDADVAAELPVGNVDAQGNIELHTPPNPPDAFQAPPTGELSVSERELAARNQPPGPSRR